MRRSVAGRRDDAVQGVSLLEARIAQAEVRHLRRVSIRGRVDDIELDQTEVEPAELRVNEVRTSVTVQRVCIYCLRSARPLPTDRR